MATNFSKAILLFNSNIRAISTIYDLEPPPDARNVPPAKRTIYKTLDPSIAKNDLVIIPTDTRYKMSVVKVVEVDVELDDYESPGEIKWIIDKIDRASFDKSAAMEREGVELMRRAEKRRKTEELRASVLKDNPEFANLRLAQADSSAIGGPVIEGEPNT